MAGVPRRIFISVGEVSGDQHAAGFAQALVKLDPTCEMTGIGGPAMAAAGVTLLAETTARAAMTFHALARVREVRRLLRQTARRYLTDPPDLHVCVDSSGMNLHFARIARQAGVPVLYYVAPQLWASRPWRIKQVRRDVDRVASIFPFETQWYRQRGVAADFVGHPLFDRLPADRLERSSTPPRYPDRPPVVGIIPGSRRSEVAENLPRLLDVATGILGKHPNAQFLTPTTPAGDATVRTILAGHTTPAGLSPNLSGRAPNLSDQFTLQLDGFDELIPRCDLCLTKSGTSTVHVAAYGVPMVVVYAINPLIWHGLGRWLVTTKKIAMVNILAGQIDLVPEFVPWHGPTAPVLDAALHLLADPARLADQRQNLIHLTAPLADGHASENVARMAMEMMG